MSKKPTKAAVSPRVGLAFLLSQVGAYAATLFGDRLAPLGLKPYDAGILRILERNSGLTQTAICGILGMFPSRLVLILDALVRRRLIERRAHSSDRRSHVIHLTEEGHATAAAIEHLTDELERDLFAKLTKGNADHLCRTLKSLVTQHGISPGVHPAYRQLAEGRGRKI
jgi:DNA-binding MarR family transcriptional regulator